jgi:hypothetical protein
MACGRSVIETSLRASNALLRRSICQAAESRLGALPVTEEGQITGHVRENVEIAQ